MKRPKKINPLWLVIILLVAVLGITIFQLFSVNGSQPLVSLKNNTPKTEETLKAWQSKWNDAVNNYCQADIFNSSSPEFQRATSLVLQRYWENENTKNQLWIIRANQPCLDIQYAPSTSDMSGADGVFLFSEENSGPKGLKILVNPSYKSQDDLTTALLLSHELTHAEQYILKDVSGKVIQECYAHASKSFCENLESKDNLGFYLQETPQVCARRETQAYYNEILFYGTLKQVESNSINSRAREIQNSELNLPAYGFVYQINSLSKQCPLNTTNDVNNFLNCMEKVYVTSNPFYKAQCGLN